MAVAFDKYDEAPLMPIHKYGHSVQLNNGRSKGSFTYLTYNNAFIHNSWIPFLPDKIYSFLGIGESDSYDIETSDTYYYLYAQWF